MFYATAELTKQAPRYVIIKLSGPIPSGKDWSINFDVANVQLDWIGGFRRILTVAD
jgi:hypothetical protein